MDPLAENYADQTPYEFAFNDPANFNDPFGDEPKAGQFDSFLQLLQHIIDKGLDGVRQGQYAVGRKGGLDFHPLVSTSDGRLMIGFEWQISVGVPTSDGGIQREFNGGELTYTGVDWQDFSTPEMKEAAASEATWDEIQDTIALFGIVPGGGDIADGINAVIYLARGKPGQALASVAAMVPFAGAVVVAGKVVKTSTQSLGTGRIAVKQWLQRAGTLERAQLIKDIESAGFKKVFDGKDMMHFERGNMKIRLDPPQPGTPFNHMHLNYGGNKNAYDIFLNSVNYKTPAAHIAII